MAGVKREQPQLKARAGFEPGATEARGDPAALCHGASKVDGDW